MKSRISFIPRDPIPNVIHSQDNNNKPRKLQKVTKKRLLIKKIELTVNYWQILS